MTLRLGGDGAITGCTSLEEPTISISGLTMTTPIEAVSGTAAAPSYTFSGDTDNGLYYAGTNSIGLSTAGTNAILIDSSGRLFVGLSTTTDNNAQLQVSSTNFGVAQLFRTGSAGASLHISSTTGTLASPNALSNGDHAGYVSFRAYDGATWRTGANIGAAADGQTWASGDCPGRLVFSTTADGASSPTERMRIDSSGNVGIGTTSPSSLLQVNGTATANNYYLGVGAGTYGIVNDTSIEMYGSASSQVMLFKVNGNNERMRIDSSGNVLVGKTVSTGLTAGCELRSAGFGVFTRNGGNPLQVRRLNSDGDLIEFYNDAALVGSLGAVGSNFTFGVAGVERMRIDSSGAVKINQPTYSTSAQVQLDAKDNTAYAPPAAYPSNQIDIQNSVAMGSAIVRFRSQSSNASAGIWNVGAVPRTSSLVSDFIFQSRTADSTYSEIARFSGSGGLTFNGDTAAANALDDYEEGTWTPASGSNFGTFSNAVGHYIKIGHIVHLTFQFNYASGSSSNSGQVTALPFTVATHNPGTGIQSTNLVFATVSGVTMSYLCWAEEGNTQMYILLAHPLTGTASADSGFIRGSITYITT